jgi:hypothetical protein
MRPTTALAAVTLFTLASCLENEEEIEVHTDGSVEVTLRATGNLWDLSGGHPLPLGGAFEPLDEATRAWIDDVGAATGGAKVRERLEAGAWAAFKNPEKDHQGLAVRASFDDVDQLPRFFAPEGEPYRSALLERRTSLEIEGKGGRTVYTFERTFVGRPFWPQLDGDDWLPEDVQVALDEKRRLTAAQVTTVHRLLLQYVSGPASMRIVTSPLTAIYTEGEASLSSAAYARTLARLDRVAREILSRERIQALFDAIYEVWQNEGAQLPEEVDLEELMRNAARETIESSLAEEGISPEVRNAVRERLEWNFSSDDQASDLGDEHLTLRVTMPGDVVGGNYDSLEGRTASWKIEGEALFGHDVRMEVVSVVE